MLDKLGYKRRKDNIFRLQEDGLMFPAAGEPAFRRERIYEKCEGRIASENQLHCYTSGSVDSKILW